VAPVRPEDANLICGSFDDNQPSVRNPQPVPDSHKEVRIVPLYRSNLKRRLRGNGPDAAPPFFQGAGGDNPDPRTVASLITLPGQQPNPNDFAQPNQKEREKDCGESGPDSDQSMLSCHIKVFHE
jgi:hypothetical protein